MLTKRRKEVFWSHLNLDGLAVDHLHPDHYTVEHEASLLTLVQHDVAALALYLNQEMIFEDVQMLSFFVLLNLDCAALTLVHIH